MDGHQRHLDARDQRHQHTSDHTPDDSELPHQLVAELRPRADGGQRRRWSRHQWAGGCRRGHAATSGVAVPSSAVDIGPDVVMAEDNTLGEFSPFQGRIYVAFVGYIERHRQRHQEPRQQHRHLPVVLRRRRPDLEHRGRGQRRHGRRGRRHRSRTRPITSDEFTGHSQYQPEIAVDPTTGTVVLSWRDARNDPANTLVATYIADQHRRRQHLQRPDLRQPPVHRRRRHHRPDGRPGPGGRQRDDRGQRRQRRLRLRQLDGPGRVRRPGLPGVGRQLRRGHRSSTPPPSPAMPCPSTSGRWSSRPGRGSSTAPWGRSRCRTGGLDGYQQAQQLGTLSFTVTFDRPINPPERLGIIHRRRRPGLLP